MNELNKERALYLTRPHTYNLCPLHFFSCLFLHIVVEDAILAKKPRPPEWQQAKPILLISLKCRTNGVSDERGDPRKYILCGLCSDFEIFPVNLSSVFHTLLLLMLCDWPVFDKSDSLMISVFNYFSLIFEVHTKW